MKPIIHTLSLNLANAYIIEASDGLVLVDAGMPGDEKRILPAIKALAPKCLQLILITHAHLDHYGSAASIQNLTGAPVAIHPADEEAMANGETRLGTARGRGKLTQLIFPLIQKFIRVEPVKADVRLYDGIEVSDFGFQASVVHTPGHTPGSVSLLVGGRLAFVGDLISNTGGVHAQRYYADDWSEIPRSIHKIKLHKPDYVYPGHGKPPINRNLLMAIDTSRLA